MNSALAVALADDVADTAAPEAAASAGTLAEAGLAAFARHAPQLHARLAGLDTLHSRLVVAPDGKIDMAFRGQLFHGGDAVGATSEAFARWCRQPERRFLGRPQPDRIRGQAADYAVALERIQQDLGVAADPSHADPHAHFCIVFGLGLGLHLAPLIERTAARVLVVVEPTLEHFAHSLHVVDWASLFADAEAAGRTIHFITDRDQDTIASRLRRFVRIGNPALLDGVAVYRHMPSSLLSAAADAFQRDLHLHLRGLGYFEDELVMTANAARNLARDGARVIAQPLPARAEPVFICGSGPSLDREIDFIKANAGRAVIVSIGSALRVLREAGLVPDFHVELENEDINADNIARTAAEFGLAGTTLLGSATVMPHAAACFERHIFYFRDRVSSTALFGRGAHALGACGPTVANAALVTLLYLGFRDLCLFGIDMGARDPDHYHSSRTFVGLGIKSEWAKGERHPVPGNFGGVAWSEGILQWSRAAAEAVLRLHPDVRCRNCSDGARIAGAVPQVSRSLSLPDGAVDRARMMAELLAELPVWSGARLTALWDRDALGADVAALVGEIDEVLAAAQYERDPGLDWLAQLYDAITYETAHARPAKAWFFGSVVLMTGCLWWYDRRIAEPAERAKFRRQALAALRARLRAMSGRLDLLFDEVAAELNAG
ncbi:MAG: motility associated factor glycosyltransferase family protein [Alphaproteobacteria bacterium]